MKYDCVIIGSGVAGLTAGLYLARANKRVMIIENGVLGGTVATLEKIENYPGFLSISGVDLVSKMIEQVSKLGVNIDFLNIKSIDFDNRKIFISDENCIEYITLIIASGTSPKRLKLEEEDKYKFRGLSYCAVCDGSLYKDKKVVVVTDGNSGKNDIEYLKNLVKNLEVIDISDKYHDNDFTVYNNSTITKIYGQNHVEGITILNNKKKKDIVCDAVFVELGKATDIDLYKDKLNLSKSMHIVTDENMHTNIRGVYAVGDIREKKLRQIVTACSDGAIAATEALSFIQNYKND